MSITLRRLPLALALCPLLLAGCAKDDELTAIGGSIGKQITRTSCPAVAVPANTGDVTLFNPATSRDASAIDVVATLTDLHGQCDETAPETLHTVASFRVVARRASAAGPRDLVLPYYAAVVRSGDKIVSKSVSQVAIHFDDGKLLAETSGRAEASVRRADATLPEAVREKIGRKRRAEDADASIDPMSDPQVRAAMARASFELLVGFQLTQEQLAYNATR
ncbi:hypothetical protein [Sphingomonas morindae]|uniref:Lipoprotein n=1 Tax=Sphingomonas morindae TaxID=1541170 RepID=A0ABY4X610_9SPHN|nr:hypothetical protein [Sphingomonas morindae]USI72287.1 hypothetical protein LHA26_13435 [Sphingomonas morindae]